METSVVKFVTFLLVSAILAKFAFYIGATLAICLAFRLVYMR